MKKTGDLLNSIPLAGIAAAAFMTGTLYGKQFSMVSWETIVAGVLGLTGGAFAWFAAKAQIRNQNEHRLKDIKRTTILENRRCYKKNILVAKLAFGISTTRELLDNNRVGNGGGILALHNQIKQLVFEEPPLAAPDEILEAIEDVQRTRQRVLFYLSAYVFHIEKEGNLDKLPHDKRPEQTSLIDFMRKLEDGSILLWRKCEEMLSEIEVEEH